MLLGFGLMALAWRRPRRRQRAVRVATSAVAAAALGFVAFPPLRTRPAARAEAILLTQGFRPDTLRRLLHRLGAGTPVWAYGAATAPPAARPLPSMLGLAEQRPALRRVHVLGRGLPAAELPLLRAVAVQLHADAPFSGFHTAYWRTRLPLGEVLGVEGTVAAAPGAGPAWVTLRAAGAGHDSVRLPSGGGPFRLRYRPKTTGLARYELVLRRAGQPPVTEPLPVEVTTPQLPAVLLLAATPSFEFKFLKNYLAEAHYSVALRTTVSRRLVQTDFVNHPVQVLDRLTPVLLAQFGVLVADAPTLATLTVAEAQALHAAVRAGRLGLVLLASTGPLPRALPARADFTLLPRPPGPAGLQALAWPGSPPNTRAVLPARLLPGPALRPLVSGPGPALVAAGRRVGLGVVVVSVVPETFSWALQGQEAGYATYWTRLLAAAVPPAPATASWKVAERWPRPHQPLLLRLAAAFPETPPTVAAPAGGPAVRLALRQDLRLPEWSTAPYWPAAEGWHEVRGPGQAVHRFYVYPASAWTGPAQQEGWQAAAQRAAASGAGALARSTTQQPWPAAWFFGLFLLAMGYLWLEEKL